jgi:hypothetical protein
MKTYIKDPGFRRSEIYDIEDDFKTIKPEPQWVCILKSEPEQSTWMALHPDSHWAEMWTEISHAYGQEPSNELLERVLPQGNFNFNYALEQWQQIKKITEDNTKRIGSKVINGKPAIGFSVEVPSQRLGLGDLAPAIIPGKIWVGRDDGVPMLIELEHKIGLSDHEGRFVTSDIQWNVPIDEKLFKQAAPVGWGLSRHMEDSIEYAGIGLSPSVTLEIGPEGQRSLVTAGDVAGLVKAERTANPDYNPGSTGIITIELTPSAAKRLHDYAEAHPGKPVFVNFNSEIKVEAKMDIVHPAQLSFDISPLGLSMFRLEEIYTTAAIPKNTS